MTVIKINIALSALVVAGFVGGYQLDEIKNFGTRLVEAKQSFPGSSSANTAATANSGVEAVDSDSNPGGMVSGGNAETIAPIPLSPLNVPKNPNFGGAIDSMRPPEVTPEQEQSRVEFLNRLNDQSGPSGSQIRPLPGAAPQLPPGVASQSDDDVADDEALDDSLEEPTDEALEDEPIDDGEVVDGGVDEMGPDDSGI